MPQISFKSSPTKICTNEIMDKQIEYGLKGSYGHYCARIKRFLMQKQDHLTRHEATATGCIR